MQPVSILKRKRILVPHRYITILDKLLLLVSAEELLASLEVEFKLLDLLLDGLVPLIILRYLHCIFVFKSLCPLLGSLELFSLLEYQVRGQVEWVGYYDL